PSLELLPLPLLLFLVLHSQSSAKVTLRHIQSGCWSVSQSVSQSVQGKGAAAAAAVAFNQRPRAPKSSHRITSRSKVIQVKLTHCKKSLN
ncbi:hypothetical protein ACMBCN_03295, partial [Candidatus Liberibacter asiaticus]